MQRQVLGKPDCGCQGGTCAECIALQSNWREFFPWEGESNLTLHGPLPQWAIHWVETDIAMSGLGSESDDDEDNDSGARLIGSRM
jgi:hypothetical protein